MRAFPRPLHLFCVAIHVLPRHLRVFCRALRILLRPQRPVSPFGFRGIMSASSPFSLRSACPPVGFASVLPLQADQLPPCCGSHDYNPPFDGFDSSYPSFVPPATSAPPLAGQDQTTTLVPALPRPQDQTCTNVASVTTLALADDGSLYDDNSSHISSASKTLGYDMDFVARMQSVSLVSNRSGSPHPLIMPRQTSF